MALGDKVEELQRTAATLTERVDTDRKVLVELFAGLREVERSVGALQRDHEKEVALLKREIDDLKKAKAEEKKEREERSRRFWAFGPNLLGAVVSGIIAAAVAYFISRR